MRALHVAAQHPPSGHPIKYPSCHAAWHTLSLVHASPVAVTTPRPCPADTVVALKAMHFLSPRPDASGTACRFLLMGTDSPVSIASCTCDDTALHKTSQHGASPCNCTSIATCHYAALCSHAQLWQEAIAGSHAGQHRSNTVLAQAMLHAPLLSRQKTHAHLKVGELHQPHVCRQPITRLDRDNVTRDQLVSIKCDALAVTEHIGCSTKAHEQALQVC